MWSVVGLLGQSDIDAVVAGGGAGQGGSDLVGVPGHVDGPAVEGIQESDVAGAVMGAAGPGRVVGGTHTDQHGADALVVEIELDLFPRALDQEGSVGVHN